MNVHQRRFIRLSEIEEKTNLTQGDILDVVDSGELDFCALVEGRRMGAIIRRDDCLKIAAVFDFNGMVKLLPENSKQFALSFSPQLTKCFLIIQPEKIMNWRSVPNVFANTKSTHCPYLTQAPIQPKIPFLAYGVMEAEPTVENLSGRFTKLVTTFIPDEEKANVLTELYPPTDTTQLKPNAIRIEPERLRLDMQNIVDVFGYGSVKETAQPTVNTVDLTKQTGSASVKQPVLTHPIQQVIANVLLLHAESNSRQIWYLMKSDVEQEQKRFDTEAVIFEITNDELSYFGLGDTTKTMSYRRFQNLLSEVRNKLHG